MSHTWPYMAQIRGIISYRQGCWSPPQFTNEIMGGQQFQEFPHKRQLTTLTGFSITYDRPW